MKILEISNESIDSSYSLKSKPILYVSILDLFLIACDKTIDESTPPDKNIPIGTSDINCSFVDFSIRLSNSINTSSLLTEFFLIFFVFFEVQNFLTFS